MFKALFMFNFAKYIEWPNQELQNEFVIGVYDNDPIMEELNKIALVRKINNKAIVIKRVSNPSEVSDANIFFLPNAASDNINQVTSYFAGKPTLIITDHPEFCNRGAGINYYTEKDKLKFEIKKSNIISHGLNMSSQLIILGTEIK